MVATRKKNSKRFADMENPHVIAIMEGMLRFTSEQKALEKIEFLRKQFVTSRSTPDEAQDEMTSLRMWVKGFGVSKEEEKEGYIGQFVRITLVKEHNRFTLKAEKTPLSLKYHPQRKFIKTSIHPNWGHPLLRTIKKKKTFKRLEDAEALLQKLHEEYPEVSIPNPKKLYIMIFSRADNPKAPIQKYVLTIEVAEDGGFYIEHKLNERTKKKIPVPVNPNAEEAPAPKEQQGYFTSMVQLKKRARKNAGKPITNAKPLPDDDSTAS